MAIIATGQGPNSTPTIVRYDDKLNSIWEAVVPHRIGEIEELISKDGRKLFAIATSGGEIFVFNQHGTLKFQDKLMEASLTEDCPIYGMDSGMIGKNQYALGIGTFSGIHIYELNDTK